MRGTQEVVLKAEEAAVAAKVNAAKRRNKHSNALAASFAQRQQPACEPLVAPSTPAHARHTRPRARRYGRAAAYAQTPLNGSLQSQPAFPPGSAASRMFCALVYEIPFREKDSDEDIRASRFIILPQEQMAYRRSRQTSSTQNNARHQSVARVARPQRQSDDTCSCCPPPPARIPPSVHPPPSIRTASLSRRKIPPRMTACRSAFDRRIRRLYAETLPHASAVGEGRPRQQRRGRRRQRRGGEAKPCVCPYERPVLQAAEAGRRLQREFIYRRRGLPPGLESIAHAPPPFVVSGSEEPALCIEPSRENRYVRLS